MFRKNYFMSLRSSKDDKECSHWRVIEKNHFCSLVALVEQVIREIEAKGYTNVSLVEIKRI